MKKWLLALMICLSFSALTAGLFLLPQYVEYVENQNQEQQKSNTDEPVRQMAGPKHIKISQRVVSSTSYNNSYTTLATQSYNSTRASWSSNSSIYTDVGLFKVQWYDENSGSQPWGADVHYYTTSSYTTQNNPTSWCGSMYYDYGGSLVAVNRKAMVTISPSSGYTMVGYGVGTGSSIPSWSYNSTASTLWMYGSGKVSTTKPTGTSTVPGSTDVHLCIYVCKKVTVTLTKNTNISYVYYKYNGKSSYDSVSYSSSVSVCVGSSFYGYATTTTGYEANYTSNSVYSKYSIASAFTFSPTAIAKKYEITLQANDATGGMTSDKIVYARYMNSGLYANSTLSDNTLASWTNPSRTGYTFSGWGAPGVYPLINASHSFTANTSYTNASGQWTYTGTPTLYAMWTRNTYTLRAYSNGGYIPSTSGWSVASGGASATKSVAYGDTYGTLPTPTRINHVFTGWYTSSTGGSRVYTSTTMGTGATIYAHWEFSVEVHFILEGPGEFYDNGCIYSWDTSGNNEMFVYFDYDDDIEIGWDGIDTVYVDIHGGEGGSFEIVTDYYFTGEIEIDYDGPCEYPDLNDANTYFSLSNSAANAIYVYFYTYKYAIINRNNTSYGTISQSQVRVSGSTTYSISSSGSTATINGTSVTATPVASTTGFTYAFGSWTIPSNYASQSFPTITANFTRTTNTRSVTLAVRTISEAGAVGNSNAIPSGASLSVSYTNSTPSSTSSSQTSASTAYTIQSGTSMTITPTVPTGYKYLGYSTSGSSKPSVNSFPTSTTLSAPSAGTYYFFFQKIAAPLYYTTERGGYWYYEDGEYPQTYIGPTLSGASATSSKFNINGTDYTVYTANGLKYIQVASPMTGSIKINNGTTVSLTAGTKYWFRIDPIRWRVSHYGAASNKYGFSSVTANLVGVSDILGHGRINTTTSTFTKRDLKSEEMSAYTQSCSAVGYTNASTNMTYTFDKLIGDGSSSKTTTYTKSLAQANTLTVASLSDIQKAAHNGTSQDNLKTYASDLSAMLQCRDYNNSAGWTSSIYNIGSGIVVGPGSGTRGAYWSDETNKFGFVFAHQASYATCFGTR